MKTGTKETLLLLALWAALYLAAGWYGYQPAECTTDLECMELCAPDDDDCDGGPQS